MSALSQGSEHAPTIERIRLLDHRTCRSNSIPIPPRVGDDQKDDVDPGVSRLQGDPPKLGLCVIDPCLSLDVEDCGRRHEPTDDRVPRSKITFDREGDLRAHPEVRSQPFAQALEQRDLAGIPDRALTWERANSDVESDDGADARQLRDRNRGQERSFDSADLAVRHRDRTTHVSL